MRSWLVWIDGFWRVLTGTDGFPESVAVLLCIIISLHSFSWQRLMMYNVCGWVCMFHNQWPCLWRRRLLSLYILMSTHALVLSLPPKACWQCKCCIVDVITDPYTVALHLYTPLIAVDEVPVGWAGCGHLTIIVPLIPISFPFDHWLSRQHGYHL